jgi:IS4 transposase
MIELVLIKIKCCAFLILIRFNASIVQINHVKKNEIDIMFIVKSRDDMHIFVYADFAISMNRDL